MINLNHITAKGMPAMRNAQAAAGQRAPMLIRFSALGSLRRSLQLATWNISAFASVTAGMLGLSKTVSFGYAVGTGPVCFGNANPPFRDNSPGKARLKLR
jgi:hypothetical protein